MYSKENIIVVIVVFLTLNLTVLQTQRLAKNTCREHTAV